MTPELTTVVADVLGDLAFMVTDDGPVELPPGASWLQADISYHGEHTGNLKCWCTRELAIKLAASLLATEADAGEAQAAADDALREFMNVLCGQLVTAWHGTAGVFTLSIPTVREFLGTPELPAAERGHVCQLQVEGEPLLCVYQPGTASSGQRGQ